MAKNLHLVFSTEYGINGKNGIKVCLRGAFDDLEAAGEVADRYKDSEIRTIERNEEIAVCVAYDD